MKQFQCLHQCSWLWIEGFSNPVQVQGLHVTILKKNYFEEVLVNFGPLLLKKSTQLHLRKIRSELLIHRSICAVKSALNEASINQRHVLILTLIRRQSLGMNDCDEQQTACQ